MGKDSVTQDFATNVWRMKQLGFNAIRLPFRFSDFDYGPIPVKHECQVAPAVSHTLTHLSTSHLTDTASSHRSGCNDAKHDFLLHRTWAGAYIAADTNTQSARNDGRLQQASSYIVYFWDT